MMRDVLATMVTTTSYGTWLPGDARRYVEDGRLLPPSESLSSHARGLMSGDPIYFTDEEQQALFESLINASNEFAYRLTDASVESWHLHWIIDHGFDSIDVMAGRLKTRLRQKLNRGRIWTAGYWGTGLGTEEEIVTRQEYIARHAGCRMTAGRIPKRP